MRALVLLALIGLAGCPSPENPARKAVDAAAQPSATTAPMVAPASANPASAPAAPSAAAEVWSCPMDPEVASDHAGKCPKCNMDLVKKGG